MKLIILESENANLLLFFVLIYIPKYVCVYVSLNEIKLEIMQYAMFLKLDLAFELNA